MSEPHETGGMQHRMSFVPELYGARLVKPELEDIYPVFWPNWPDVDGTFTRNIFRFLPISSDCPTFWEDGRVGPWLYAGYGGQIFTASTRVVFLLGDSRKHTEYAIRQSPYWVLYDRVVQAVSAGSYPQWRAMNLVRLRSDDFDRTKPPVLQKPSMLFLAQVQVVSHSDYQETGGKYNPRSPVCLLAMRGNIGWTLISAIRQFRRNPAYKDILDPEHGVLIEFRPATGGIPPKPGCFTFPVNVGYCIDIHTDTDAPVARDILEQTKWWFDLLHFPSEEEQVRWLTSLLPTDVTNYAFRRTTYEQFIPGGTPDGGVLTRDYAPDGDRGGVRSNADRSAGYTQQTPVASPNMKAGALQSDVDLDSALNEVLNRIEATLNKPENPGGEKQ